MISTSKVIDILIPSKNNRLIVTTCVDGTLNIYDTNAHQSKNNPFRTPVCTHYS